MRPKKGRIHYIYEKDVFYLLYAESETVVPPDVVAPMFPYPPKILVPPESDTPFFSEAVPDVETTSELPILLLEGILKAKACVLPL